QARGPLPDVAADDIEHQIDAADAFQRAAVEVDKLLRAEVERLLTVGGASSADHVGAGQSCELRHHRPDCASRAVRDHALPRPRAATTPASSWPGIDGVRSRSRRSVQVEGHAISVGTNPDAWI